MICVTCKEEKSADDFPWRNQAKGQKQNFCKECKKVYNKTWYLKNKEKHLVTVSKNNQRYRPAIRKLIRETKNVPCMDCGISYPYYVMDFDHREDKKYTVGRLAGSFYSLETIRREMDKCDVVCANCHRIRTHKHRDADVG